MMQIRMTAMATAMLYDACGRMTEVQDPGGNILHTYEYNGHGQILREVDGEGKEVLYTYNDLGWKIREQIKVQETDPALYRVIAYTYDSQGNKVEEAYGQQEVERDGEPDGWHRIHFSYDKNNHLNVVKDDFGAKMRYDYDCLGNVTLEERVVADGVHSVIHYAYNKNGWLVQRTEEIQGNGPVQAAVTRYAYDANGNLTKITTPKGSEIHRSYDADDRLTEERVLDRKNGIDRRVQYAYDAAGNVLKQAILGTDGECLESSTRYDLKDRATHRTNPAGGVTRYLYDRNDRLRKEIRPYGYEPESDDGAGVSYTYDSRGNRLRTTNALGEVVQELSYNLRNQPVIQKDTFGNRTELSYELDGKIKDVRRLGNGNRNHQRTLQQYEYNARGQITGVVDGNRNPISYDVDSWGRITGIGFVDGVKEGYEYTPAGQVSRTIDGNGNAVQYRYNSLGKISERIDQLGFTETFRYDEEGNLSLHIDRDGRQLQRACNVFGQPVYEKASDAEGKHTNISTWHYDSLGRVTRAVCDGKSYEYIYDAYGNLKEKRSNGKRLVSYAHDRAGQITEIRDPAGVSTRYEYDILGRRSRIFNDDGLEVRYGYDALNRISRIHYGNGVETAYTYDGDGNVRTLETRAGENVLISLAYRYDGNGNRTAKAGTQAALGGITSEITAGNNALDLSYAYDVRGQLLEERRNGASVCYAYDKAGNRIRKTDAQGETRYLYNEKNQLVEEESPADRKQFSYDRQGGIIEEKNAAGIRLFSYNSRHQQTRVETETGSVQENRYDAEGLRFELLENGRRTSFVYHDGELLHEEGREEQEISYHLGAGMEAFRRGQELSYYHRDEQLSTVFVTDGQGEIRNSYQYDAFGIPLETTEQLNNRIRYTGQQYDELTEQYYLRARYYNPVAGRFMQEDVYQGDGLNLYAYCGNNPVVYDDPSGYASTSTGKACPPQGKISESVDETSYGKSSSNCTELVPYYPANNGAESGTPSGFYQDANGRWHRPNGDFASNAEVGIASPAKTATESHGNSLSDPRTNYGYVLVDKDTNEILKFGETLYPETRYSKSYLEQNNAVMKVLESGSKEYIHYWQYDMNKYFEYMYDEFPPLLKSKGW
ncbi:RHS repeat-associated core domain-containing protein [Waltera sp.]|uniref:RHS repeat-associated core domain-containing protein n=1 Tax=Waltera sp. TaxID=2815806 RepID=UPI0039A32535